MNEKQLQIECLFHAQAFETYWAYYSQSSGRLFNDETRKVARSFLQLYEQLVSVDAQHKDPELMKIGKSTDVDAMLESLKDWATSQYEWPWKHHYHSRFMLFAFLTGIKTLIGRRLGISEWPKMTMSSEELEFSTSYVRWSPHLPSVGLRPDPETLIQEASTRNSIVVIGDIRKSQDLMTYAQGADHFSEKMVEFLEETRENLEKHAGFFDKFTGDGFLAYFNQAVCEQGDKDYVDAFLGFVADEITFANEHFGTWTSCVRKLPDEQIGLAIGADLGIVAFKSINRHLVAVSESIVWAARMASAAKANEVIVNNLLYQELKDNPELQFEDRPKRSKSGEAFLARALTLDKKTGAPT